MTQVTLNDVMWNSTIYHASCNSVPNWCAVKYQRFPDESQMFFGSVILLRVRAKHLDLSGLAIGAKSLPTPPRFPQNK